VADVKDADAGADGHVLGDDAATDRRGYSTGMSQPLNSTIFAPIWRWTAFKAVLRTLPGTTGGVASATDTENLGQNRQTVAGCRNLELIKL
jgi:hypothetical protein